VHTAGRPSPSFSLPPPSTHTCVVHCSINKAHLFCDELESVYRKIRLCVYVLRAVRRRLSSRTIERIYSCRWRKFDIKMRTAFSKALSGTRGGHYLPIKGNKRPLSISRFIGALRSTALETKTDSALTQSGNKIPSSH
jgi:hypothetical protein